MVLAGGGSGGHIYPALAMAGGLQERLGDGVDIQYVGGAGGMEQDLVPRAGVSFHGIRAGGLLKPGIASKVRGAWRTSGGLWQSLLLLRRLRPDVVVGTGGYVAGPVGLAASWLHVPLVVQEQNVWPGLTNRWLARRASLVLAPHAESVRYFPDGTRLRVVGNPVRASLAARDRAAARAALGIPDNWVLVVATGGSQGAPAINRLMAGVWRAQDAMQEGAILWACGPRHRKEVEEMVGEPVEHRLRWVEYLYDMDDALAAADLVVGRAGAMTLAEAAARGLPQVLVPSPHVSENHQERNARHVEQAGAAVVVRETEVETLGVGVVLDMMHDAPRREAMGAAASRLHHADALERMVDAVVEVAAR